MLGNRIGFAVPTDMDVWIRTASTSKIRIRGSCDHSKNISIVSAQGDESIFRNFVHHVILQVGHFLGDRNHVNR